MSASTVSITANPSARRRPVVVGDKKSGIELVATDAVAAATSDKISNGKDLSHSIRGEVVLERSRDVVQVKKALPNSDTALPSRRTNRKGVSKTQKPLWQTIISASTKKLLLVLVLLGLVQMIRILLANPATISPITSSTEFERRIAEVEGLLVTTTKMMRVEVDLVDQKILNQIGGLRTELNKKIEDKGVELETGLKNLEDRTESLENSLGELKATEWLSKEDFVKFLNEFKKAKGLDHGYTDLNLDEMRAFAREIVEKEFEKHSADGLGRVDYALASGGAMIVKHSEPYTVGKAGNWFYTANRNGVHNDAEKMLSPSFGEPGHCFPLKGNSGFVQIKLRTAIVPEAVTLEHVAKSVAYDRSSAPKDCRVSGWLQQGRDPIDQVVDTENMFFLLEFTYDLDKSHAQTFNVLDSSASSIVNMIRLDFTSNHGSPSHTCIYRLRVHGYEPSSVSMLAI